MKVGTNQAAAITATATTSTHCDAVGACCVCRAPTHPPAHTPAQWWCCGHEEGQWVCHKACTCPHTRQQGYKLVKVSHLTGARQLGLT